MSARIPSRGCRIQRLGSVGSSMLVSGDLPETKHLLLSAASVLRHRPGRPACSRGLCVPSICLSVCMGLLSKRCLCHLHLLGPGHTQATVSASPYPRPCIQGTTWQLDPFLPTAMGIGENCLWVWASSPQCEQQRAAEAREASSLVSNCR